MDRVIELTHERFEINFEKKMLQDSSFVELLQKLQNYHPRAMTLFVLNILQSRVMNKTNVSQCDTRGYK